jgi:hypothetical protein
MVIETDLMEAEIVHPAPLALNEPRTVRSMVLLGFSTHLLAFARRAHNAGPAAARVCAPLECG